MGRTCSSMTMASTSKLVEMWIVAKQRTGAPRALFKTQCRKSWIAIMPQKNSIKIYETNLRLRTSGKRNVNTSWSCLSDRAPARETAESQIEGGLLQQEAGVGNQTANKCGRLQFTIHQRMQSFGESKPVEPQLRYTRKLGPRILVS